jgi:hypothetical protein
MLTEITLAVGLLAIAADPASTTYTPRTLPSAYQQAQFGSELELAAPGGFADEGFESPSPGCASCNNRHHTCGPQDFRCHFLFSPCDMSQHMPFWNKERGYYYFRPYHVVHVLQQQEKTASWGGNVHNPYDNRFLDKIHEEWSADFQLRQKAEKVENLPQVPGLKPTPPVEPQTPEKESIEPQPTEPQPLLPDPAPSVNPQDAPPESAPPKVVPPEIVPPEVAPLEDAPPKDSGAARARSLKKFVTFR